MVHASKDDIYAACFAYWGDWESTLLPGVLMGARYLADVLTIALNPRKRALHDFIAGSFVITKRSYDAILGPAPMGGATPGDGLAESGPA